MFNKIIKHKNNRGLEETSNLNFSIRLIFRLPVPKSKRECPKDIRDHLQIIINYA